MDERQKRIIEKIGEPKLIEMSEHMAEVSRRIADVVKKSPIFEMSETWRKMSELAGPSLLVQQNSALKSLAESPKFLPDYSWLKDAFVPVAETYKIILESMRRLQETLASANQFQCLSEIIERAREYLVAVGQILDENDRRREEAEREAEKIPAKFGTVHDKVHTVVDAQMDIRLLKKIEANCLYLIDKFEKCIYVYNGLDADESELEQTESTLQMVRDYLLRCREQLKDRYVQLELLAEDDAEKQAQIEEVASKIVEEILLPYVSTDPEDVYYVFTPACAREYVVIEKILRKTGYLNAKYKWIADRQILATFIETLRVNNYFRHNASSVIIRRRWVREFFEQRYGVKISEQLKPSKVKDHPLLQDFPVMFNLHPTPKCK